MKTTQSFLAGALLFGAISIGVSALAEEPQKLKIGGKLWSQFTVDATNYPDTGKNPPLTTANKMGLDIYRAYLIADYKYDDVWSGFLLLDASRSAVVTTTTTTENQIAYVKDMYVQNSNLFGEGLRMRFGYFPIFYDVVVDSISSSRWLVTNMNDTAAGGVTLVPATGGPSPTAGIKTIGFTPPHTGGVEIYGKALDGGLQYAVTIHNGSEGNAFAGNNDSGIAYMVGVDYMPFKQSEGLLKGLGIIVSDDYWGPAKTATSSNSAASTIVTEGANLLEAALHFNSDFFDGTFEYGQQSENFIPGLSTASWGSGATGTSDPSAGWCAMGSVKLMNGQLGIFGRYITGTTQFQNNKINAAYIMDAGPTWTFISGKLMTGLLYEVRAPSANTFASATFTSNSTVVTTSTYMWKWAANF